MSTPALPGLFGTVEPFLNHYGYFAVALFVAVEDFGIPVPGETILIAAALFAGAGKLNIVLVGIVATLAAIAGDNIGFAIGHFGGRTLALRWGKYVFLTEERLDKAQDFFERHGGKIIVVARFIEGLRQANGIVAGISGMHWRRFFLFNALGAALWVGTWVTLGYVAGSHITTIYNQITRYSLYVLIALAVAVVAFIAWRLWRRRGRRQAQAAKAGEAPRSGETPEPSETPDHAETPERAATRAASGTPGEGGEAPEDVGDSETLGVAGPRETQAAGETSGAAEARETQAAGETSGAAEIPEAGRAGNSGETGNSGKAPEAVDAAAERDGQTARRPDG